MHGHRQYHFSFTKCFWNVSFFRDANDWEVEAYLSFIVTIYGSSIRGIGEDKMCWKLDRNKGFWLVLITLF